MEWETAIPILAVVVPLLGALATWALNERSKRIAEEYRRKEERYTELVSRIRAFTTHGNDPARRSEFIDHLNLAWLYCSDEVIQKAYAFLDSVHVDAGKGGDPEEQLERNAVGELMVAIRTDLVNRRPLRRTELKPGTFRLLSSR
jgi:hypothetical protein